MLMILSLIKSALCFCLCLSSSLFVYSETFLRPSTSAFIITLPSHQIREMKGRPHESNLPLSGEAGSRAQNPHLIHINNTHTHTHMPTYMVICMRQMARGQENTLLYITIVSDKVVTTWSAHTHTFWPCKSIGGFVLKSRWPERDMSFKTKYINK